MAFSIPRSFFPDRSESDEGYKATYQLHGICDASNCALSRVIYLRRVVNGRSSVAFVQAKSKVISLVKLTGLYPVRSWRLPGCAQSFPMTALTSLQHLSCSLHLWLDSQVVLRRIANPDLHLPRFVKRRVDKILLVASANAWSYVSFDVNPADVGTREDCVKKPD